MNSLSGFFYLSDPNARNVVIGVLLLTITSSVIGCFTFLRKRALVGDAVAHSVLPGVCLAFLISGTKNPLYILIGAFITGWISIYLTEFITRNSKIKEDTAIGLILSVFFGIGILLLTSIQHSGNSAQTGLDSFIFGKAASLMREDVWIFGGTSLMLLLLVIVFFKEFTLLSFDKNFAQSSGLPVRQLEFTLTTMTVLAVVVGIQAVGVVLMAAMLITPAAAARFWSDKLRTMVVLAAILGGISGIAGAFVSYAAPSMPTGPWIVMIVSLIAIFSFVFAPRKGIFSQYYRQKNNLRKILEENILKVLFHIGEKEKDFHAYRSLEEILAKRKINSSQLVKGLNSLRKHGYVVKKNNTWSFTEQGKKQGLRVTRLHRLWEMYLTRYLQLAPDHVHDDAETIEHIITPEIERKIDEELNYPKTDPHQSEIPDKIL